MTDYTELKRLAEAAQYENCEFQHELVAATKAFFVGCIPEQILALIAENERVKARLCVCRDCGGQGEVYSGHSSYQVHNQPPEPDMDVCGTCGGDGVLGPLEDFEALADERDQLKAENEALRKIISDSATSCGAAVSVECSLDFMGHLPVEIFSVISKLRNALAECADSLHCEMLQKFGGQLPDDMHPVTRREYDRDMAEAAGYRAAMGQGEQS